MKHIKRKMNYHWNQNDKSNRLFKRSLMFNVIGHDDFDDKIYVSILINDEWIWHKRIGHQSHKLKQ